MTAARYWRIFVNQTGGGSASAAEIQLRETPGGSNVATGGAASSLNQFSGSFPAANAFDGNNTTLWAGTSSANWVKYDFGASVTKDIVEVAWRARSDGFLDQNPTDMIIQYSPDDINWIDLWRIHHTPFTVLGEQRVFTLPSSLGACRYWAIRLGRGTGQLAIGGVELDLAESNGGADISGTRTSERAFSTFSGFPASNLFDGNNTTLYSSNGSGDIEDAVFIGIDFGSNRLIQEIKWRARDGGNEVQSPARGWIERSADNINFLLYWAFTSSSAWSAGELRTFRKPTAVSARFWRFQATTTENVNGYYGIRDLKLFNFTNAVEYEPESVTASVVNASFPPANAVDADASTFWTTLGNPPPEGGHWLTVSWASPKEIEWFFFKPRQAFSEAPSQLRVLTSNDGTNFTPVTTYSSLPTWGTDEARTFLITPLTISGRRRRLVLS